MSTVKIKKVKKTIKDEGLADMFNQMLGAGSVNMNICYPKYDSIRDIVDKLLKVVEVFNDCAPIAQSPELANQREEIRKFLEKSRVEFNDMFSIDLKNFELNLNLVDDATKEAFTKKYEEMKKSELVTVFIKTCENLVRYKKWLNDADKLSDKFILNMAGAEFCPLHFSTMNFKYIIEKYHETAAPGKPSDSKNNKIIEFILTILHKLLHLSFALFKNFSKPDIDVEEFVKVIMDNIDQVQKHVPRCEKAFKKIKESVELLRGNFDTYYKDFIESQDQMVIMQNFVNDVARDTKADAETTMQFRKIISHYKNIAQHQIKNPKIKMLFEKVSENLKELETHDGLVGVKDLEDSDEEIDEETAAARAAEKAAAEEKAAEEAAELAKKRDEYYSKSVDDIMKENGLTDKQKPRRKK